MIPRLYIDAPLKTGAAAPFDSAQAHYLKNVLRRAPGDEVRLFNGRDGEFAAEIAELKKKGGLAGVKAKTREQTSEPELTLYFAPVKRGALETIVQKATEIGVAALQPVLTGRTVASKLNVERLQAIAVEAAEQSGRLSIPSVGEPIKFARMFDGWPENRRLLFCDEAGDDESAEWGGREGRAPPLLEALKDHRRNTDQWAVLTGPEGGFAPEEREALRAKPFVTAATLGPRILRADTAAISALVLWQAALGDWIRP
ncbi:16S rRNA (uracil(1498)-N(3))-methyltransferase [Hyphococcus sp.]|uniref:16S rRNA (uracil(1498)-N(3))-methyltransferase n=1 Tax=Hyphococcus sp. TaxID=2038636 RepID=UPI003CCBD413